MYSSSDIFWIKNVKRKDGEEWAYDDETCGTKFLLNWPTSKKGSASTPNIGDIIVLFQKPNKVNGKKNYDVHLTHLVTPVSDIIHIDNEHPEHKWCREVMPIAIANPIYSIPNKGQFNFFIPNRGLTNPIKNLISNYDLTEIEIKESIWYLFKDHFCKLLSTEIYNPKDPVGIYGEVEGDKIIREHIIQELYRRNSKVVQEAKVLALKKGNGRILCESCKFDFYEKYGELGEGFIECHHKIPISKGQRMTKTTDLALVCSNCHRMLHRKNEDGTYHNLESLVRLIKSK